MISIERRRELKRESNARIRARDPEAWADRRRGYVSTYRGKNPERVKEQYRRQSLRRFGLTPDDYDQMLAEQGGVCAICCRPERSTNPQSGEPKRLAVDHCHKTGRVRGLLCAPCNKAIGAFDESEELLCRAITYLS